METNSDSVGGNDELLVDDSSVLPISVVLSESDMDDAVLLVLPVFVELGVLSVLAMLLVVLVLSDSSEFVGGTVDVVSANTVEAVVVVSPNTDSVVDKVVVDTGSPVVVLPDTDDGCVVNVLPSF